MIYPVFASLAQLTEIFYIHVAALRAMVRPLVDYFPALWWDNFHRDSL